MMVSVNGPSPAQRDHVVMAAMRQHFKGRHGIGFLKRSSDITVFDRTGPRRVFPKMLTECCKKSQDGHLCSKIH